MSRATPTPARVTDCPPFTEEEMEHFAMEDLTDEEGGGGQDQDQDQLSQMDPPTSQHHSQYILLGNQLSSSSPLSQKQSRRNEKYPSSPFSSQAAEARRQSLSSPVSHLVGVGVERERTTTNNSGGGGGGGGKRKLYAVRKGRVPGLYYTWKEAEQQVRGFADAEHKSFSFSKREDAENYVQAAAIRVQKTKRKNEEDGYDVYDDSVVDLTGQEEEREPLEEMQANQAAEPEIMTASDLARRESNSEGDFSEKKRRVLPNILRNQQRKKGKQSDASGGASGSSPLEGAIGDDEANALMRSFGLDESLKRGYDRGNSRAAWAGRRGGIRVHNSGNPETSRPGGGRGTDRETDRGNSLRSLRPPGSQQRGAAEQSTSRQGPPLTEELSSDQQRAIDAVLTGKNVFITGGAGVGKSFIVQKIVERLEKRFRKVQRCASTGIAAVHIQGQTLHSFAGIPIDKESKESVAEKNYKSIRMRKRWTKIDVLLIDEISMVSAELFDMIDFVAKRCRGTEVNGRPLYHKSPMGGVQVIVVGDFCQLPPADSKSYAYESSAWKSLDFVNIVLKKIFRQKDPTFIRILNSLRFGRVSDSMEERLLQCDRPLNQADGILPTKLYPLRTNVEAENKKFFDQLDGQIRSYECRDFASSNQAKPFLKQLNTIGVPGILETRPRMQVMLKTNLDISKGLCNGSRGVILGYKPFEAWLKEARQNEELKYRYSGCLQTLKEWGEKHKFLPFVLFSGGIRCTIPPATWERKFDGGRSSVTRLQVPLIPAWALTIHKSQGMSLDRVHINLGNAFGCGMSYVALSRARALDGLCLQGFRRQGVRTDRRVIEFYQAIDGATEQSEDKAKEKTKGKQKKVWSTHLEDQVKEVVRLNFQAALTQVFGMGGGKKDDLQFCRDSFVHLAREACKEVLEEADIQFEEKQVKKEVKEEVKEESSSDTEDYNK